MHLDNLSDTKEKVHQCQGCGSIWTAETLGEIKLDNYHKLFCTACCSTDIKLIPDDEDGS